MGKSEMKKLQVTYEELASFFNYPTKEKLDKLRVKCLMASDPEEKKAELLKKLDKWEKQTKQ